MFNHSTNTITHRSPLLRRLVIIGCLALGSFVGVASGAPVAQAATFGTTNVFANAIYNCANQTVRFGPLSSEPVGGPFTIYARGRVYDLDQAKWISEPTWTLVDPTPNSNWDYKNWVSVSGVARLYQYAIVDYAKLINGKWSYRSDWVEITEDLDNYFCRFTGF